MYILLQVFEHGFTSVKLPKNVSDDPDSLFMGFPECGSSYFMLMQLDKEFKPCPKLIEAQADSSGRAEPFGDMSEVIRVKNLDISRMHMCEDELNLSLLDRQKILSILNDVNANEISEHGLPTNSTLEGSFLRPNMPINFCSIVDEVFELEKGPNGQITSSTSVLSSASHFGLGSMSVHGKKPSMPSPNWEGAQPSQNAVSNYKSSVQSASTNSLTTSLVKSQAVKASKSDQDLAALRSPHSGGSFAVSGSNSWVASPICKSSSYCFFFSFNFLKVHYKALVIYVFVLFLSFYTGFCCSQELESRKYSST